MDQNKYNVTTNPLQRHRDVMGQVGDLIEPKTTGFEHINLDMTFTNLNQSDSFRVENLSKVIDICHIKGFKQAEYLARGELATILNSRRSKDGTTMKMFTDVNNNTNQTFKDETQQKKGFSFSKKKSRSE